MRSIGPFRLPDTAFGIGLRFRLRASRYGGQDANPPYGLRVTSAAIPWYSAGMRRYEWFPVRRSGQMAPAALIGRKRTP
jgi:hypothetical protein